MFLQVLIWRLLLELKIVAWAGCHQLLLASSCASGLSAPVPGTSLHSTVGSQDLYAVLKHPSEMTWIFFLLLSLFREKRGRKKCDWEGWLEW